MMFSENGAQLSERQIEQLLKPINPKRVLRDGKGHSHVSQQDITAHLIRVFGFGGFDFEVLETELMYLDPSSRTEGRWDACYRARVRLTVRNENGLFVACYEDGSMGEAMNQSKGAALDLAYKSAISLSKKRAAISLGDQFGLSLYNKGQMEALVQATLVHGEAPSDVQENVQQQVALGNDEIEVSE
jgi:recombination DNA repair RAD52 pathway protein